MGVITSSTGNLPENGASRKEPTCQRINDWPDGPAKTANEVQLEQIRSKMVQIHLSMTKNYRKCWNGESKVVHMMITSTVANNELGSLTLETEGAKDKSLFHTTAYRSAAKRSFGQMNDDSAKATDNGASPPNDRPIAVPKPVRESAEERFERETKRLKTEIEQLKHAHDEYAKSQAPTAHASSTKQDTKDWFSNMVVKLAAVNADAGKKSAAGTGCDHIDGSNRSDPSIEREKDDSKREEGRIEPEEDGDKRENKRPKCEEGKRNRDEEPLTWDAKAWERDHGQQHGQRSESANESVNESAPESAPESAKSPTSSTRKRSHDPEYCGPDLANGPFAKLLGKDPNYPRKINKDAWMPDIADGPFAKLVSKQYKESHEKKRAKHRATGGRMDMPAPFAERPTETVTAEGEIGSTGGTKRSREDEIVVPIYSPPPPSFHKDKIKPNTRGFTSASSSPGNSRTRWNIQTDPHFDNASNKNANKEHEFLISQTTTFPGGFEVSGKATRHSRDPATDFQSMIVDYSDGKVPPPGAYGMEMVNCNLPKDHPAWELWKEQFAKRRRV
ncbi:MAG: hypothetical protein M1831_004280 [Alyxoria varia]|nr:MAG: hypothetical protein M1831_004280 [Alyxoria varia]